MQQCNYIIHLDPDRLKELKDFRSDANWEVNKFACYEPSTKSWTTQLMKREINKKVIPNFVIPGGQEAIKLWSIKYGKDESLYRDRVQRMTVLPGIFQFCGCDEKTCLANAAASNHFCGYCLKRLFGYCLQEPGEWGVCRKCFLNRLKF